MTYWVPSTLPVDCPVCKVDTTVVRVEYLDVDTSNFLARRPRELVEPLCWELRCGCAFRPPTWALRLERYRRASLVRTT